MKKICNVILEGISFGSILCIIATILELQFSKNGLSSITMLLYVKQLFCAVLLGVAIASQRVFYEDDRVSKAIQSVVSFTVSCTIYVIALLRGNWFEIENINGKIAGVIMIAIVVILVSWGVVYFYNSAEIRKINLKNERNKQFR